MVDKNKRKENRMKDDEIMDQNDTQGSILEKVLKTCGKRLGDCTYAELGTEARYLEKRAAIAAQAEKVCALELKYRKALVDNPRASHAKVARAVKKYRRMWEELGFVDDADRKECLDFVLRHG